MNRSFVSGGQCGEWVVESCLGISADNESPSCACASVAGVGGGVVPGGSVRTMCVSESVSSVGSFLNCGGAV